MGRKPAVVCPLLLASAAALMLTACSTGHGHAAVTSAHASHAQKTAGVDGEAHRETGAEAPRYVVCRNGPALPPNEMLVVEVPVICRARY